MRTKFSGILTLLLAFVVQFSFAQEKLISGTVSDETGPLPGVSILRKGTTQGTETDFDGKYSVKAKVGDILIFSFVGMKVIEKKVGASNKIDVKMESSNVLKEVVLLGYTSKKKNELTGSSIQVGSEEISETPVTSVEQALQGKVAGLSVSSSSGTPGTQQDIRIRGISSITSSNTPLYVIDGVPIINSNLSGSVKLDGTPVGSTLNAMASFDSDDIESITVLKDASATSAYGARGANGVILITTKSGKKGKVKYQFSTSIGFSNNAVEGRNVLTPEQVILLSKEAFANSKTPEEDIDKWKSKFKLNTRKKIKDPNWDEAVTNKDALQLKYNFSASGGGDFSKFHVSLGYLKSEATVLNSDFERINSSLSFTRDLNDKLTLSTKVNVSNSIQNGLLEGDAYYSSPRTVKYLMSPLAGSPYNEDGSINTNLKSNLYNPLYIAKHDIRRNSFTRILNNSSLQWNIIDKLKFKTNFSIDYLIRDYKSYQNRIYGDALSTNGENFEENYQNRNWVLQNSLSYKWLINDLNTIDFTGVLEYQENDEKYLGASGEEFPVDGLTNLDVVAKPKGVSSPEYDWFSTSYLLMANYKYSNKYFIDLTYRREGSSKFSQKNRFGNFWSVGAAWNIHNEEFFANLNKTFNTFRIRGSYGVNGNANIKLNKYQPLLGFSKNYLGKPASYPVQLENEKLTWEKNSLLDIGTELGILDNKITANFSYFSRDTYDLLFDVPISPTSGHVSRLKNVGEMNNKGIEVLLNFNIISKKDFNLSFGGNIATVKNKVLKLAKNSLGKPIEITTNTKKVQEGKAVYSWYMKKYAGVNKNNGNAMWYINGKDGATTENYEIAKENFIGGSALPTITGGLNTHIDYKGFFINANLYFAGGHKVYETLSRYTHQGGKYNFDRFQGVEDLMDRWQKKGDITDVPKVLWDDDLKRSSTSSRFLYDGDYARLKNLTFGYNFNKKLLKNTFLSSARFYVKGTNLFTWVKDDKLKQDPEVAANGFISLTTPPTKTISFGANFKF